MLYLLIVLIGGLLSYFGPWWVIAPVCFAGCWWRSPTASYAFWVSALAGLTLWLGYSTYLHVLSEVDLVSKVAGVFTGGAPALANVPGTILVFVIAALVVGLVSGFSGLAGMKVGRFIHRPAE
ncbi:hypothetical protein [Parapedobacter tibetensis]|uniref:hypothetical protein n=1 Tax=Parapedobacter tibetensis TaxID=2972951 RepID=UPI00214DD356|nr:hypothetical protein [Parapedobacter tibetensis]